MSKRYTKDKLREMLVASTLLDPRYNGIPCITEDEKSAAEDQLQREVTEVHRKLSETPMRLSIKQEKADLAESEPALPDLPRLPDFPNVPDTADSTDSSKSGVTVETEPPVKRVKTESDSIKSKSLGVDDWFSDVIVTGVEKVAVDHNQRAREEICRFLKESRLSGDMSTLEWWKMKEVAYPALAVLAQRYLSIPATSVPSERVFSAAGLVVNKQRSSLKTDNVDKLIFLNKNLKKVFDQ